MRLSKFNIKALDAPDRGKTAVFNTLTRGLVVLKNRELERLERGDSSFSREEIRSLEGAGVLVPEGVDEDRFFDVYHNQVRFHSSALRIVLHPTLNCNFACPYCYEGDLKSGKKRMSVKTAESAVSWMKERALESRVSKIRLEYIGGEPLLNLPVIERVGSGIYDFCGENGMTFASIVITNGYLLTREVAERLAAVGVTAARITIDGPEEIHDSLRSLRGSGRKTYKTIIKNLQECKDILTLSVTGNFTRETMDSMPGFLDGLIEAGLGPDVLDNVQLSAVAATVQGGKGAAFDRRCIPPDNMHEIMIKGYEEIIKRGFGNFAEPEFSPCPAICSGDYTINWDGALYKCPCLVGHQAYEVGHISEELRYNAEMINCLGINTFENEKCRNCNVLPLCLGGCRYMALVENGNFHSLDCQQAGIQAMTLETVRRMAASFSDAQQ